MEFLIDSKPKVKLNLTYDNFIVYEKCFELIVQKYHNLKVTSSLVHRDFSPWNVKLIDNNLYLYDWEYSKNNWVLELDYFHFFIQPLILKNFNSKEIYIKARRHKLYFLEDSIENDVLLLLYLLDIITMYSLREATTNEPPLISKWISLISFLLEKRDFKKIRSTHNEI
jgi:hypothetical protein